MHFVALSLIVTGSEVEDDAMPVGVTMIIVLEVADFGGQGFIRLGTFLVSCGVQRAACDRW